MPTLLEAASAETEVVWTDRLTPVERAMLQVLQQRARLHKLARTDELYEAGAAALAEGGHHERHYVRVNVCRLRRKLPAGQRIETVPGVGYRLVVEEGH